jgi:hypothetical protein
LIGISILFSIDESTNLADVFYLRALNILFILLWSKQNIKSFNEGKTGYQKMQYRLQTSLIGVLLALVD